MLQWGQVLPSFGQLKWRWEEVTFDTAKQSKTMQHIELNGDILSPAKEALLWQSIWNMQYLWWQLTIYLLTHLFLLAWFYLWAAHWAPHPENVHLSPWCCWCFLVNTVFFQRWSVSDVSDCAPHHLSEFGPIRWCDTSLAVLAPPVMAVVFLGARTWITTASAPGSRNGQYHLWRNEIKDGGGDGNLPPSVKMEPPAPQMAAAAELGVIRRHAPPSTPPARIYVDIHHRHMWPRLVASRGRGVFLSFFLCALDDAAKHFNAAQPARWPRV